MWQHHTQNLAKPFNLVRGEAGWRVVDEIYFSPFKDVPDWIISYHFSAFLVFQGFCHCHRDCLSTCLRVRVAPEMPRVFLGNLPSDCRVRDIEDFFREFGKVCNSSKNIQGVFLTGPPLNLLSVGRKVTDFKKNVRVPDWPPPLIGKRRSVWWSECDSNTLKV